MSQPHSAHLVWLMADCSVCDVLLLPFEIGFKLITFGRFAIPFVSFLFSISFIPTQWFHDDSTRASNANRFILLYEQPKTR